MWGLVTAFLEEAEGAGENGSSCWRGTVDVLVLPVVDDVLLFSVFSLSTCTAREKPAM